MAAPVLDGTAQSGENSSTTGTTLATAGLTTSNANDIIVIQVFLENTPNAIQQTVSSVAKTSGTGTVGTFTKRSSNPDATHFTDHEVWWALASTTLSAAVFTVTYSGAVDNASAIVFAVSGANTSTPWDANASLPKIANGTASTPTVTGVSTTNANTLLLGFTVDGTGIVTAETAQTAGTMAGSTGTLVLSFHTAATDTQAVEELGVTSVQSNVSIAFGTATPLSCPWFMIADAIQAPASGAAPTWGFSSRREDERPSNMVGWRANLESSQTFFRPSQNPVPTTWLPTTGADRERLPPIQRTDWPPQWFVRSPNPVPIIWPPTTGEEDRPPAQKRPADEAGGFAFAPPATARTTPSIWWQATPDGYIKPIPRPPDEPFPWFVRSPNPVPTSWLPTTGQEDRPPNPNRIRSPDEPFSWFVRSPNPVPTTLLPTTGEEDRPPPLKRPPDEPGAFFRSPSSFQPILLPTTGQEDRPPAQKRPPDEPFLWFVQSPSPVPTRWLPTTGQEDRLPPFRPDLTPTAGALKLPPPPVGISGMAWFNPSGPDGKEYPGLTNQSWAPAWAPQVITVTVTIRPLSYISASYIQ